MVAFIDVLRHPDKQGFANPELMEIVHRNWPGYLEQFEVRGMLVSREGFRAQEDIHNLRSNGISSLLTLGNKLYMGPGMGVTSAATSTRISLAANRVRVYVDTLVDMVCDPSGQFQTEIARHTVNEPRFSLAMTPAGLAVYEEVTTIGYPLSKWRNGEERTLLNELRNLFSPDWAIAHLISAIQ